MSLLQQSFMHQEDPACANSRPSSDASVEPLKSSVCFIKPAEGSTARLCQQSMSVQQRTPAIPHPLMTHSGTAFADPLAARTSTTAVVTLLTIKVRVAEWIERAADYRAAAALYEHLSRLSDAELHRRGLSRTKLAHDVIDTRRRGHGSFT